MKNFDPLNVQLWLYCKKCSKDKPKHVSMQEYCKTSVGRTEHGILVWCERHQETVAHLAFDWSGIDAVKKCQCENCK